MKRIIKYNYIDDNISLINNLLLELNDAKTKLLKNINLIGIYYQSEDHSKETEERDSRRRTVFRHLCQ